MGGKNHPLTYHNLIGYHFVMFSMTIYRLALQIVRQGCWHRFAHIKVTPTLGNIVQRREYLLNIK
jgi:hypothetical protein